ncbi:MAG: UDP-N-acetylmuramoyl-L-alanine--D-glutamate ligase [Alphaproteobacteria bacterium]|nr:UDP-N-acetylmuramoyl-L-alanine--D-glutamate ligase [Alphaproteobacteria bacterium]
MIDLSKFAEQCGQKPVAVFGLARSGLSTIKALRAFGIEVLAWDDREEARNEAEALGATCTELDQAVLQNCATLILAPGVPLHFPAPHPVVKAARAADIEIICDVELFSRYASKDLKFVGITGTNGKSTTTALLEHVLKSCGISAVMGGNIGRAVFDLDVENVKVAVLELSSYQLDLCPSFTPDIAVLLNITPDHLDRHGSMENYIAAKNRIFREVDQIQINMPDIDDRVCVCTNMKGDHNLQNATAALLVCEALGLAADQVLEAIKTFPGLAHRQYLVREIGGVLYVNDSKATNVESASKALASYDDIFWIAGGQIHNDDLKPLEEHLHEIRHAYLIGETSEKLSRWLDNNQIENTICGTMKIALEKAHSDAQENKFGVVLLSPIYKSFDQFKSFEHRGDVFATLVESL